MTSHPVRIVHLGLGAFFRAHQAWYTHVVDEKHEWGIAAFTGRSPQAAQDLIDSGYRYTLVERSATKDSTTQITSVVRAFPSDDFGALTSLLSQNQVSIVTLTITEGGYRILDNGDLDLNDLIVKSDIKKIEDGREPESAIAKLALALDRRRTALGLPIAVVPCDNFPSNGTKVKRALLQWAKIINPESEEWFKNNVSCVSTSVDRITPRSEDNRTITEPFSDWVLSGDFPSGRPEWEKAGAKFVSDIELFERRKLWLLNGAHSLLSYLGLNRGYETVSEAMKDEICFQALLDWWQEAKPELVGEDLNLDGYCRKLQERFENPRIAHQLSQIAQDGSIKLGIRVAPVAQSQLRKGLSPESSAAIVSQWITYVLGNPSFVDVNKEKIVKAGSNLTEIVSVINKDLSQSEVFMSLINIPIKANI